VKKNKTIAILVVSGSLVGVLGIAGVFGIGRVLAEDSLDGYPKIIQNLAEKFGLNPDEVAQVFEDTRDERIDEHLDQLVENGEITSEQKDLIITKMEEVQAKIEEIRGQEMTADERRDAMQEVWQELRDWANENDIPMYALRIGPRAGLRMKMMDSECDFGHR